MDIKSFILDNMNLLTIVIGLTFSVVLWIKGKGAYSLRGYIPTLWTSLGILGTFTAIYFGLTDYSNGESSADIDKLIAKVIPAFSTSIIGIIGAIVSTIINRWVGDNIEKADYEQFVKIKNKIPGQKIQSNSPEMVLLEIISAIRESSNQTCEKLKNNKDSSEKKLEQINTRLNALDTTAAAVGDRIKSAITDCMNKQREEFSSAISLLISTLSSELKSQSNSMADKMDDLRRMLHDEVEHIESTNQSLISQLIKQEEALLNLTTQTLLKDSETRNKSLQEFIAKQNENLTETFAEITAGMGALYQKIEESITVHINDEKALFEHEIKESIEEFAKTKYNVCTETITKCNQELTTNIERLHQNHIQASIDFVSKLNEIFAQICNELGTKINSLSDELVNKLNDINEGNISTIENTVEQNRILIGSILEDNSKEIQKTAKLIKEEQSKFHILIVEEHDKMRQKMQEQFNSYLNEINRAMNDTCNLLDENSKNTTKISDSINETLSNLCTEIQKSNVLFLNNLDELKKQLMSSAGTLSDDVLKAVANSSQIKQLESMAKNLTSAIESSIKNMSQEMSKVSSVISSSVDAIEKSSTIYSDSVAKSDMITRYMESTSSLFMQHNNAISVLDNSLKSMIVSIKQMSDMLASFSANRDSKTRKAK